MIHIGPIPRNTLSVPALRVPALGVLVLVAAGALYGCAGTPDVFSDDGARISFKGSRFKYQPTGQVELSCKFDKQRKLAVCDNGLTSELVAAGLPFHGVVFVDFDGRRFKPANLATR